MVLSPSEREHLLKLGTGATAPIPERCLHEMFETAALRQPDAVALVHAEHVLTYRELDRCANRMAHRLRDLGVAGERVAVVAERSVDLVAGILAVLKAGGAYVPIDPADPEERVRFLLDDIAPKVVLVQQRFLDRMPACDDTTDRTTWLVLDDETTWADEPWAEPTPSATPSDTAYVIYTSGSTGRPKGVLTSHRAIVNRIEWMQQEYRLTATDTVLQKTPYTFDVSVWEIFWPLAFGARLVLADPGGHRDAGYLARLIERAHVTICHFVPSMLRVFLDAPDVGAHCSSLRDVICSGEALTLDLQRRFFDLVPARLHNLYGPTEAAIDVTAWECRREDDRDTIPIGRPITNLRLHVLDERFDPLPAGGAGELFIGGAGLADGYLNRAELTERCFVPDPHGGPGERLYRTGDRARMLPDGTFEFLGRLDNQVKIRGVRVELGEVESVLLQHPAVTAAAVIADEVAPGDRRLVGYVVTSPGAPERTDALDEFLREFVGGRLPAPMVPALWVELERIPLTSSGKVDRRNLPAADWTTAGARAAEHRAPETASQVELARLWGEILDRDGDDIGQHDDFFALGGNSLLAGSLVARIHRRYGVDIPLGTVFESSTLSKMDTAVRAGTRRTHYSAIPRLDNDERVPLSFEQQRFWFLEQLAPGTPTYNLPMLRRLRGRVDEEALRRALTAVVDRHEAVRTTFQRDDGEPHQVVRPDAGVPFDVENLDGLAADDVERRIAARAWDPFDLARGPLLRATLFRLDDDTSLLLVVAHHIVFDGWSETVFFAELTILYEAAATGDVDPLPALPVRYRDYAAWQRRGVRDGGRREQVRYWEQQLAGSPDLVTFPADRSRPPAQTFIGRTVRFTVPARLAGALDGLGHRERVTRYMILLAAFKVLLARHTGQPDVVVGSPVANRGREETAGLVGLLLNTLVLRTDLSGEPSMRELLARVRRTALGAYAHQDVQFEELVALTQPDRRLDRTPLFQVLFNLIPPVGRTVEHGGLSWTRLELDDAPAKYDVSLYVWDGAGALECALIHNADLFTTERMRAVADQYLHLLEQLAIAEPDQPVRDLSLVTANAREVLPRPTLPIHPYDTPDPVARCTELARRHPGRRVMVDPDRTWTWHDLDTVSAAAADWLRERDIAPGGRVAVLAHRTGTLAGAVLGVMRTGAAFALLEPSDPAPRRAAQLAVLRPDALIDLRPDAPDDTGPGPVLRPADLPPGARPAAGAEPDSLDPDAARCVLFTSGSTGTPKAVVSGARPLSRFLAWQADRFGLGGDDRMAVLSGLGHDPLLRDVFGGLLAGGEVHWPPGQAIRDPGALTAWLASSSITTIHLTPALLELMIGTANPVTLPEVRHLFSGGDRLTGTHVAHARALFPNAEIVNLYGTTETPQAATYHVVPPGPLAPDEPIPIGHGATEAQPLVLAEGDRLAGIGELGEVVIRSPYLALGYLGYPQDQGPTTGQRFTANPFRDDPSDRIYRTGDLGRYAPDGAVEFVGRRDRQLNLRGHRVEPAEVESVLIGHADVWETAVFGVAGELCAYVVPEPGALPTVPELRDHLRARLPDHMVPRRIAVTDVLPLTSNGKVDHRALAARGHPADPAPELTAQPLDELEAGIAELWRQVLGALPDSPDQSFFDGGHSLLAVRFVTAVQEAIDPGFSLRHLFKSPSFRGIAATVRGASAKKETA